MITEARKMRRRENSIIGIRINPDGTPYEVKDESEHFYVCAVCGQAVDMRDLGEVFHHETPGHKPIELDS